MYTEGFVKLHRKALETSILKKEKVFTFFLYCLMRAAWKDTKLVKNGEEIEVPRGSFFTTEKQDLKILSMTRAERRTCLKILENCQSLYIKTYKDGTMLSVCNFNRYQDKDEMEHTTKPETNRKPTGNQRVTKEEGKEKKEYININKRNSRNEGGRTHSVNKISPEAQKFMEAMKARVDT